MNRIFAALISLTLLISTTLLILLTLFLMIPSNTDNNFAPCIRKIGLLSLSEVNFKIYHIDGSTVIIKLENGTMFKLHIDKGELICTEEAFHIR